MQRSTDDLVHWVYSSSCLYSFQHTEHHSQRFACFYCAAWNASAD